MSAPQAEMSLIEALRAIVGDRHVLTDADLRAPFELDWTRRFGGPALAVVRPGSTSEVSCVLRACTEHAVAVVPQGGNTGLVGGGVPRGGEVLVSLSRMSDIGEVDTALGRIEVGAGTTLAALQQRAAEVGLEDHGRAKAHDHPEAPAVLVRHDRGRTLTVGLRSSLPSDTQEAYVA